MDHFKISFPELQVQPTCWWTCPADVCAYSIQTLPGHHSLDPPEASRTSSSWIGIHSWNHTFPSLAPDPELLHSFLTTSLASREVAVPPLIPSATCSHGSSSCANLMALLYIQSLNRSLLSSGKKECLSMEYKVIFWGKIYLYFGLCLSFQPWFWTVPPWQTDRQPHTPDRAAFTCSPGLAYLSAFHLAKEPSITWRLDWAAPFYIPQASCRHGHTTLHMLHSSSLVSAPHGALVPEALAVAHVSPPAQSTALPPVQWPPVQLVEAIYKCHKSFHGKRGYTSHLEKINLFSRN